MGLRRTIAAFFYGKHWVIPPPFKTPQARGAYGERVAEDFLCRDFKYRVLYRNFRTKRHEEIDLVCRDAQTLVFVEVRSLSPSKNLSPAETITKKKQEHVVRAALEWLHLLQDPEVSARFDVVEVILDPNALPLCRLISNAFPMPERWR